MYETKIKNNNGYVKSVKMMDGGHMEQGHHRSFVFRAETETDRDTWLSALRAEVPAEFPDPTVTGSTSESISRSLSATPVTSLAATPIGTPSESGRRRSRLTGGLRDRKRRTSLEAALGNKMNPPVIRGWARTQSNNHEVDVWCVLEGKYGHELYQGMRNENIYCKKYVLQAALVILRSCARVDR